MTATPEPAADEAGLLPMIREGLSGVFHVPRFGRRGVALLIAVALIAWALMSIYRVQPDEQGVVLRFGRWVDTVGPGLHVHWPPPIESVLLPKVTKVNAITLGAGLSTPIAGAPPDPAASSRERQMLTGDENIVEADCTVFWRIRDAGQFLFRVETPELAVKVAAEGALRDVISRTPIQAAMSDKRQQVADETLKLLQSLLDREHAGVEITQVQLQRVEPPLAVIDAFNDVQRARADQVRARNEAEAYANDILPRARGEAERMRQDAQGYRESVVNLADGEASAFRAVYASYLTSPEVTSWRLYLESVDEILNHSGKVVIDTSGKGAGSVTPYMNLIDQRPKPTPEMLNPRPATQSQAPRPVAGATAAPPPPSGPQSSNNPIPGGPQARTAP
jgi:membrane protease subunit HflK